MFRSFFSFVVAAVVALILAACGTNQGDFSKTESVDDISSMIRQADGTFRVTCNDGRVEVVTAQDLRSDRVCQTGGGGSTLIFCTSSSDNLLKRGSLLLHDFDNPNDCQRAATEARTYGAFCSSSSDNLLKDLNGAIIYDYDNPDSCQSALRNGGGGSGNFIFCTSSSDNLLKRGTILLHDFDNPTDCGRASQEAKTYGAFCTSSSDNLLKDLEGNVIHDFDNPDSCQAALRGN